jgi:hypothetical protein
MPVESQRARRLTHRAKVRGAGRDGQDALDRRAGMRSASAWKRGEVDMTGARSLVVAIAIATALGAGSDRLPATLALAIQLSA